MQTTERNDRTLAGTGFPLIKREDLPSAAETLVDAPAPSIIVGEELAAPAVPDIDPTLTQQGTPLAVSLFAPAPMPATPEVDATMTQQGTPLAVSLFVPAPTPADKIKTPAPVEHERQAASTQQIEIEPARGSTTIFVAATLAAAAIAAGVYFVATRAGASDDKETAPPAAANAPVPPAPVVAPAPIAASAAVVPSAPVVTQPEPVAPTGANELAVKVGEGSCSMHVTSTPGESTVMLDGRAVGSTPLTVQGVYCGRSARLVVNRDGFAPWERRVSAEEGRPLRVVATLRRPDAPVVIESTPVGATIKLDGKVVGTTPTALFVSPNVRHSIELSLDGYQALRTSVVAQANKRSTVNVSLTVANDPMIVTPFEN